MLALALLVCGAIGITASAETEPTLTLKKNVSFVDTPSLVFAVEGVEAEADVELRVYASAEATEYYTATAIEGGVVIDEVEYPAFYLAGIYPKDIANEVYVKAVSGDKESAMLRYSILEFALEGIYTYTGVEGKEEVLDFFKNIINYSSSIQYMLSLSGKFDGINAADYRYVNITDGNVDGNSLFITTEDTVTVSYTGSIGKEGTTTFNGWNTTIDGVKGTSGTTITLGQVNKIEPNEVTLQNQGQEMDGRSLNSSNKLSKLNFANLITAGGSVSFVTDPVNPKNTAMKITRSSSGGSFYIDYTGDSNLSFAKTVLEFRMLIVNDKDPSTTEDNLINSTFLQVGYATGSSILMSYNLNHSTNGYYSQFAKRNESNYVLNGTNGWLDNQKTYMKDNEWATIRLEYYNTGVAETTKTELFVNGVSCGTLNCYNNATANSNPCYSQDVHRVYFAGLSGTGYTIYIDNPSLYQYEIPAAE